MPIADFIHRSNQAQTLDDLVKLFYGFLGQFGYKSYCCFTAEGLHTDSDLPVNDTGALHYNKAFVEHYRQQKLIEYDPIYKLFWHARGPFTWEQVMQLPLNKKQQAIMQARQEVGFRSGIGIPIQSSDPKIIGMNLKSDAEHASDKNSINKLYAACNQFQLQRSNLLMESGLHMPDINLTHREKEILEWCSQGKSNSVIGEILGISEKTVEFHFKSIFSKLDVSSRTTAVVKAVHLKLIYVEPATLPSKKTRLQ